MQLASTIGASFGWTAELIEAGALAHDVGHAPLTGMLVSMRWIVFSRQIQSSLGDSIITSTAIDVVRWLESPYAASRTTHFTG